MLARALILDGDGWPLAISRLKHRHSREGCELCPLALIHLAEAACWYAPPSLCCRVRCRGGLSQLPRLQVKQRIDRINRPLNQRERRVGGHLDRVDIVWDASYSAPRRAADRFADITQPVLNI